MGDSDDWTDKAEEERLAIIAKYDKGREEGAVIEPWDDPGFEIYHVTDHYGFIHDQRFPLKFNPDETKFRIVEAERADKWIKMHASWDKYRNSEKLRKRTFKGIPNKVRGLFWGLLLDLPTIKEQQKGKYEEMYQLARKHSLDVRQIDLDVNRTYRDHVMFRERYGVKQRSLFNILCAYSIYNSEVGYCQGMSQVAALLLTYMDEEDAFWGLSQLMSHHKYGMHGFFIAGFPKLVRFQQHHDKMLKAMMPKVKKLFDKQGVDVGLYTLKWFFQCFLDRVPFELALRLWDIFLLDGDKVLICGAYTILKLHQKQLLARKNMDDLLDYLQSAIPNDTSINNDKAIETYQRCMEELHRKKLDTAGEAGEEELPKKPFGLLENIVKPVPPRKEEKISANICPTPPSDKRDLTESEEAEDESRLDEDIGEDEEEGISMSRVTATSKASSSIANSPRNFSRPLSSISNFSYVSAIEEYHSSNKSTPLKMNGYSSSTSKGFSSSSTQGGTETKQKEDWLENGSVDTVESIEIVENSGFGGNTSHRMRPEGYESIKTTVKVHLSSTTRSNKAAEPPHASTRSPEIHRSDKPLSTTISVVENNSHNGGDNSDLTSYESSTESRRTPRTPGKSGWASTSVNIPTNEAVRIHVPYSDPINLASATPAKSNPTTPSRSNFDTLKNDPNRIKIDISSK